MSNDYREPLKKRKNKTARISLEPTPQVSVFPTGTGHVLVIGSQSGSIWLSKEDAIALAELIEKKISEMAP